MTRRSQTNKKATKPKLTDPPNINELFINSGYSSFSYYATHSKERAAASARFRAICAASKSAGRKAR